VLGALQDVLTQLNVGGDTSRVITGLGFGPIADDPPPPPDDPPKSDEDPPTTVDPDPWEPLMEEEKKKYKRDPTTSVPPPPTKGGTFCCFLNHLRVTFNAHQHANPLPRDTPVPGGGGDYFPRGMFMSVLRVVPSFSLEPHPQPFACGMEWEEKTTVGFDGVPADGEFHAVPDDSDQMKLWRIVSNAMMERGTSHPSNAQLLNPRTGKVQDAAVVDTPGYFPTADEPARTLEGKVTFFSGCPDGPTISFTFKQEVGPRKNGGYEQHGWINGSQRF